MSAESAPPEPPATKISDADTLPVESTTPALAATVISTESSLDRCELTSLALDSGFAERYLELEALGRGGMGEVRLYDDLRVGRKVALKVMAHTGADAARFLREARVQGQLEHPAIVPVYDLGRGPSGEPYFTMKRLKGMTLEQILRGLRDDSPDLVARYSRRKLLTEFGNVCQAVEYAHSRGVLHRDLKPSNIMLGDFGEVYVLDWGVAKIAGVAEELSSMETPAPEEPGSLATARGVVMGTPGYMAPEQLRGETDELDERADLYALGAILFELLTLSPLHQRGGGRSVVDSTLAGADARASVRVPECEVPPELEAACVCATELVRDQRYPSVAALRESVEGYLDGDRDLARRRELAERHAELALAAVRELDEGAGESVRAQAVREAGRALALDPTHDGAIQLLSRLMLEPPRQVPDEVEESLAEARWVTVQVKARAAAGAFASCLLITPFMLWMGVIDWVVFYALGVALAAIVGLSYLASRGSAPNEPGLYLIALASACFLGLTSRMFGPFMLVPGLTAITAVAIVITPQVRFPLLAILLACSGIVGPFALELAGVLAPSYSFADGVIQVHPRLHHFPTVATQVTLVFASCAIVVVGSLMILRYRNAQMDVERQLHLQSWQLSQLVPGARPMTSTVPRSSEN